VPSSVLATTNTYWAPQSVITNNQQTIVNTSKVVSGSGIYVNQSGTGVNLNIAQQGPNNLIKGQDLSAAAQIIGDYNSLTVNQNTSGNVLGIDVNGNNNTIDITQNKNQTALIGVTGNSNSLTMEQQIFGVSGEHFAKINISR
jgi:GH25 family lysozyme M1 (1,4-beta-N-acetylmuramidase)